MVVDDEVQTREGVGHALSARRYERFLASDGGKCPVTFPSHQGGFLGGEYGYAGDPGAFAATLREVLSNPR